MDERGGNNHVRHPMVASHHLRPFRPQLQQHPSVYVSLHHFSQHGANWPAWYMIVRNTPSLWMVLLLIDVGPMKALTKARQTGTNSCIQPDCYDRIGDWVALGGSLYNEMVYQSGDNCQSPIQVVTGPDHQRVNRGNRTLRTYFQYIFFITINKFWRITAVYVKSNMKAVTQVWKVAWVGSLKSV